MRIIFKYVVDDFPMVKTSFVDNTTWEYMDVLRAHFVRRIPTKIDEGVTDIKVKYRMNCRPHFVDSTLSEMHTKPHVNRRLKTVFEVTDNYKVLRIRRDIESIMNHVDYSKLKFVPHGVILEKLGSHDQFTLGNRDSLTLKDMDEETVF